MTKKRLWFNNLLAIILIFGLLAVPTSNVLLPSNFGFAAPQGAAYAKAQPQLQELAADDPGQMVRAWMRRLEAQVSKPNQKIY